MNPQSDVVVVGAGPYGLSIAAHLKASSVRFRVFGSPMYSWHKHAPKGMRLKSEGFASDLYAPGVPFPLSEYCAAQGIPYGDVGVPISVEAFVDYGLEFQRRYVPEVEDRQIVGLERIGGTFRLLLDNGDCITTRNVILATGMGHFTSIPPVLAGLPGQMLSHSWNCSGLDQFAGREVAVIGAGASALNSVSTLLEGGASVTLLARRQTINFHSPPVPGPRALRERIRWPQTGLGTGWRSVFCTEAPLLFRRLPERTRHQFVRSHLGPAAGWYVRDQVLGKVPFHTGVTIERAETGGDRALLHVRRSDGEAQVIAADHVVAATGFDIDVTRLPFLSPDLLAGLRMEDRKPVLSSSFESSVPGLFFVGTAAAYSFGPLLRFAYGARFAARRISRRLMPARAAAREIAFSSGSQLSAVKP